jgi:hypothetical protein
MESLEATEREVALHGTLASLTKCVRPCRRMRTYGRHWFIYVARLVWPRACLRKARPNMEDGGRSTCESTLG